ncbi:hypothetical protein MuYL_1133 [Mucilaginibacter xinganensis]|uniref:Uncharacterized protein n=1 Tax=Mucilaginibacter xinganensis TaxID=1234841 RepID=A0A223NT53_9SPHI|nr:hypothetical protein MuYL_1133 [Mucilaginibacter xinganensis]
MFHFVPGVPYAKMERAAGRTHKLAFSKTTIARGGRAV